MTQKQASWALLAVTIVFGAAFMAATQAGWGHSTEVPGTDNKQTYGVLMTLFAGSASSLVSMLSSWARGEKPSKEQPPA